MTEIPSVIPITERIQTAILNYLEKVARTSRMEFYTSAIEALRVDVGRAVLEELDLYDPPRPAAPEVAGGPRRDRRQTLPFLVRAKVMARDGFVCLKCGATSNLTVDHIVPVALGGGDDEANLRTLCGSCNSRKGARLDP